MKRKLSGAGSQSNEVEAPGVLLTLSILRLNSVPDPFSGVVPEPVTHTVFPGITVAVTVQPVAVSPAGCANGGEKPTTVGS